MQFHQALSRFELQTLIMAQMIGPLGLTQPELKDPKVVQELAQLAADIIVGAVNWGAAKVKEAETRA